MIPRIYIVALCTCLGGFTFGYDVGIISGVLTVNEFHTLMGITPSNKADLSGNIASALQLGGFLGVVVQPFINDRFGRKICIMVGCIFFIIGGILQTFAWDIGSMYAGRIISGAALFAIMISISMFNAEMAPKEIRGRIIGIQQLMVTFGTACAYWLNYILLRLEVPEWVRFRIPFGLQVLPCLLLFIGLFFVPKSPRWLASKGRFEEASLSLATIREMPADDVKVVQEMNEIASYMNVHDKSTWKQVFSFQNLDRLSVGILLLVFQQFCGQNMITYFAPTVFHDLGLTGKSADLLATGLIGIVRMIMTFPALYVIDKLGRRPLMLIGTSVMMISFLYIGIYATLHQGPVNEWGYIAITLIYFFMSGYSISWGILHYVIPAEIYPQEIRAKAETVGAAFEGLFQILSIKMAPVIIEKLSTGNVFFLYMSLLSFYFCWIFVCLPETKGLGLEQIHLAFSTWKRWKPVVVPLDSDIMQSRSEYFLERGSTSRVLKGKLVTSD